jgi:hypothetical protein
MCLYFIAKISLSRFGVKIMLGRSTILFYSEVLVNNQHNTSTSKLFLYYIPLISCAESWLGVLLYNLLLLWTRIRRITVPAPLSKIQFFIKQTRKLYNYSIFGMRSNN